MNVYPIGTKVKLSTDIPGVIIGIWIEPANVVSYRVVWWNGRDRKIEWLSALEFDPDNYNTKTIGFIE